MSSSYRISLNNWLKRQNVNAEVVFDVGGAQEKVKDRVASWNVKQYYTFDLESPHKDSEKPDVVLDLNEYNPEITGFYKLADVIYCLEVFDYVYDPVRAMRTLADLLKKQGRLFVSFPFMYPQHQPIKDDALRYTLSGIIKIADKAGLEVVSVEIRKPETNILDQWWRVERLRAAKNVDHNVLGYIVELKRK